MFRYEVPCTMGRRRCVCVCVCDRVKRQMATTFDLDRVPLTTFTALVLKTHTRVKIERESVRHFHRFVEEICEHKRWHVPTHDPNRTDPKRPVLLNGRETVTTVNLKR